MLPLISICVPTYGQPQLLQRCLQSIAEQDYPNIEVIVSDDTPDERVKIVCNEFKDSIPLQYFHNCPSLGSPANWNAALDKAKGEFLLLLHHDDWLVEKKAVSKFSKPLLENHFIDVVFGATDTTNANGISSRQKIDLPQLRRHPENLLLANKIGPPSNLMVRKLASSRYNTAYKWLVDIEYYLQLFLKHHQFYHIPDKLIEVGIHPHQTTGIYQQNQLLVLRENILFANQYQHLFVSWRIYDHYWRLIRNTKPDPKKLEEIGMKPDDLPVFIREIISAQKNWGDKLLAIGPISKSLMFLSYLKKQL